MKKQKKRVLCLLLSLVLAVSVLPVQGIVLAASSPSEKERTILLYACGADLESKGGYCTGNIMQILSSEISEKVNFLVLTGGSAKWELNDDYLEDGVKIDPGKNQLWLCSGKTQGEAHGKLHLLGELPGAETTYLTDKKALQAFLDYAGENYPAKKHDLILWDHGGGPVEGYGFDERDVGSVAAMSLKDICSAIAESRIRHLDIVDFDACLMGNVEVVTALAPYADNVVASGEVEPGFGQEYSGWLTKLGKDPAMSGYELGRAIVDSTMYFYNEDESSEDYGDAAMLSVVNTKNFMERLGDPLIELMDVMLTQADEPGSLNAKINFYDELLSRDKSVAFGNNMKGLYDLGLFVTNLGICMSEHDNMAAENQKDLSNEYTALSMKIMGILNDQDFSGNDVVYTRVSDAMTVPIDYVYSRDKNGKITVQSDSLAPTGLSIYFAYPKREMDMMGELQKYIDAMEPLRDALPDSSESEKKGRALLEELMGVSAAYGLILATGREVSSQTEKSGKKHITYRSVKAALLEGKEEEFSAAMRALKNYCGKAMDLQDEYDAEDWLAAIVSQQTGEAVYSKNIRASKETTMNSTDGYHISVSRANLRDVDEVEVFVSAPTKEPLREGMIYELVLDMTYGGLSEDYLLSAKTKKSDPLTEAYLDQTAEFDVEKPAAKYCYALTNKDGSQSELMFFDWEMSRRQNGLWIPVEVDLSEEDKTEGYLAVQQTADDTFAIEGFMPNSDTIAQPVFSFDNEYFEGAKIRPMQRFLVNDEGEKDRMISRESFAKALSIEASEDCGLRIKRIPVEEMAGLLDLSQKRVYGQVTDIYGKNHNITDAIEAADAGGVSRVNIASKAVKISVPGVTYTGKALKPAPVIKYGNKTLKAGTDYQLFYSDNKNAGTGFIDIYGKGSFYGLTGAKFKIAQAKSKVSLSKTVSLAKVKKGAQTAAKITTLAAKNRISISTAATAKARRKYLSVSADKKTIRLKKGAPKGTYKFTVAVSGGSSKTYSNLTKKTYSVTVR